MKKLQQKNYYNEDKWVIFALIIGLLIGTQLSPQGDVHLGQLSKNIFSEIPEIYFTGLKDIILTQITSDEYFGEDGEDLAGYYNSFEEIILFEAGNISKSKMNSIMRHEIGHNIVQNILSRKERKEWEILFNNTKKRDFITPYASKKYTEDFSVNIQAYFGSQNNYIRCYFNYYENYEEHCWIDRQRLNFIIENIIMIYEPEKIERVKEFIEFDKQYD